MSPNSAFLVIDINYLELMYTILEALSQDWTADQRRSRYVSSVQLRTQKASLIRTLLPSRCPSLLLLLWVTMDTLQNHAPQLQLMDGQIIPAVR
jgi:hypothetical protein